MTTGHPSVRDVLHDAVRRLRRPLTPTLISVLIVLAATTAVFATTGISTASQQRTMDRLNSPEGRLIAITDQQGDAGLLPESVVAVATLAGVEWAAGIGPAQDMSNSNLPGGGAVAARPFYGELPAPVHVDTDRILVEGDALTGPGQAAVLGLGTATGAIGNRTASALVVGDFVASSPLPSLNDNTLLIADATTSPGRLLTIWVSVDDISRLPVLTEAVKDSLIVANPGALQVDSAAEIAELSADVVAEMERTAVLTITGLLAAAAVLIGAVQYGRVAGMTRDIGRRRALGATRSLVVATLLINSLLCALAGAALGAVIGLTVDAVIAKSLPPAGFTFGVCVLTTLAALAGTVPPAVRAARLDPVKILRVP